MRVRVARPEAGPGHGDARPRMLTVCAIMKNEGPRLQEWLTFHAIQGVERFLLYDNGSTDQTFDVLRPWLEAGHVELVHWPDFVREGNAQYLAYAHAVCRTAATTRWLAVIDIDEFLYSPAYDTLPDALRGLEHSPAVGVFRREFGTAGRDRPFDGPVIAGYDRRLPVGAPYKAKVKSIVQPALVSAIGSAHHFELCSGHRLHDEHGGPLELARAARGEGVGTRLRVNHYITRSRSEFMEKLERGTPGPRLDDRRRKYLSYYELLEREANVVDRDIQRFLPELRTRLSGSNRGRLRLVPGDDARAGISSRRPGPRSA